MLYDRYTHKIIYIVIKKFRSWITDLWKALVGILAFRSLLCVFCFRPRETHTQVQSSTFYIVKAMKRLEKSAKTIYIDHCSETIPQNVSKQRGSGFECNLCQSLWQIDGLGHKIAYSPTSVVLTCRCIYNGANVFLDQIPPL